MIKVYICIFMINDFMNQFENSYILKLHIDVTLFYG